MTQSKDTSKIASVLRFIMPILFIAAGIAVASNMIGNRPRSEEGVAEAITIPVEVVEAKSSKTAIEIAASGKVVPDKQVIVLPQVSGKVAWISEKLIKGGRFTADETILKIEATDFELAVDQAKSAVKQAEVALMIERSRGAVARDEWKMLNAGRDASKSPLALRKPQLNSSKHALKASEASLKAAQLNLKRTVITAPFNCIVIEKNVDVGQVVSPASQLMTLVGTDRFLIEAQVKMEDTKWMNVGTSDRDGSDVRVTLTEESPARKGKVIGLGGKLDNTSRTATLLIAVENPLEPNEETDTPLYPNAWANVFVQGAVLDGVIPIPRSAVGKDNTIWIVSTENRLTKRTIEPAWKDRDFLYAPPDDQSKTANGAGIKIGEKIIVSSLSNPMEGLQLSIVNRSTKGRRQ